MSNDFLMSNTVLYSSGRPIGGSMTITTASQPHPQPAVSGGLYGQVMPLDDSGWSVRADDAQWYRPDPGAVDRPLGVNLPLGAVDLGPLAPVPMVPSFDFSELLRQASFDQAMQALRASHPHLFDEHGNPRPAVPALPAQQAEELPEGRRIRLRD